jgi:hypothetical protein
VEILAEEIFHTCGNTKCAKMAGEPVCISDFENFAEEFLPKNAWDYYSSGANEEITLNENRRAFDRYKMFYIYCRFIV